MYWLYGPRQFCNVGDEGNDTGTLSTDQLAMHDHNDCTGSAIIKISTIGSLMLRYSPILSFNDISNSAHTMSTEESSRRASLVRDSVRGLVIMINRQNFTASVCLNSALVIFTSECLDVSVLQLYKLINNIYYTYILTDVTVR